MRYRSFESLVLRVVAIVIRVELLVDEARRAGVAHVRPLGVASATVGEAVVIVSLLGAATRLGKRSLAFHKLLAAIHGIVLVAQVQRDVVWVIWKAMLAADWEWSEDFRISPSCGILQPQIMENHTSGAE